MLRCARVRSRSRSVPEEETRKGSSSSAGALGRGLCHFFHIPERILLLHNFMMLQMVQVTDKIEISHDLYVMLACLLICRQLVHALNAH